MKLNTNSLNTEKYDLVIKELYKEYIGTISTDSKGLFYERIRRLMPEINEFDFCDFIKYMLDTSLDSVWTELLICLHSKFAEIPCSDIISFFESITIRFHRIVFLIFLCKYLEVDGLVFLSKSSIKLKEKDSLVWFLRNNEEVLIKSKRDIRIIKKFSNVTQDELKKSGKKITNCLMSISEK